jgi:quercetin dioxygenase-like cupin family protein
MRLAFLVACAVFALAGRPAAAVTTDVPPHFVVYGKDLTPVPMAEWEANGKSMSASGKSAVAKAPKKAVRYTVKSVAWPTGTVRVLSFTKAGGVLHAISDETEIYVLHGSIKADVGGTVASLKAGDVAAHPSGVIRTGDVAEDTTLVTWNVGPVSSDVPTPTVVRGDTIKVGGNPAVVQIRRYEFPGNSVRVATMAKGSRNGPATAKTDSLMYITEGHVQFTEGDQVYDVHAGDFLWEAAGQTHNWEHLDGGSFVTTSGLPKDAGPMKTSEAVDHPENAPKK